MSQDDSAQDFMMKSKELINVINNILMDPGNKFTKEQVAKIMPKTSDLLGTIGLMAIKMGITEGELTAYKQMALNPQPITQSSPPMQSAEIIETLNEMEDRKVRASNLIIHNLPESSEMTQLNKIKDDANNVLKILNNIDDLNLQDNIKMYRLGVRKGDKARPIKIELLNPETAKRILYNKQKLPDYIRIYQDQTLLQRKQLMDLRSELDARIKDGESNLTIKYINSVPRIIAKNIAKN